MRHMRAIHAMGNWSGNVEGFKAPLLANAPSLAASNVSIQGSISSFQDGQGVSHSNDSAKVTLRNVVAGNGLSFNTAGFWVFRDLATGAMGLQFRPQLDPNLAGITGFSGDVNLSIPGDGAAVGTPSLNNASGDARQFVLSVLAHAPEIIAGASTSLANGSTLGQPDQLKPALERLRNGLNANDAAYFGYLKSMNVEWIGISVAIHYDSYLNPQVVAHTCANAQMADSAGHRTVCTFPDEDLKSFIARARNNGFKIYLTLAFAASQNLDSTSNPTCGQPNYKMSRWWLGAPVLPANEAVASCIPASAWWWNPSHPDYAANTAAFWSSYQQVAVKYGALAEEAGVDLYSLGTETDNLFRTRSGNGAYTNHFKPELQAMVAAVRSAYNGALTYDQHSNVLVHPEWYGNGSKYLFDDADLDVVGISAYFQLASAPPGRVLSAGELEAMWEDIFQGSLLPLRATYPTKPIVFTEIGYTDDVNSPFDQESTVGHPELPYDATHPTPGMVQQQNIYQTLFTVNARHGELASGMFFWGNDYFPYNPGSCDVIEWTLRCRPARQAVTNAYAAWKRADALRVFDWAASVFPQFFGGTGSIGTYQGFYYRYYPQPANYLALKEDEETIVVHNGRDWVMANVGTLRNFLNLAAFAGF